MSVADERDLNEDCAADDGELKRTTEIQRIVDDLRAANPSMRIYEIVIPDREGEIFLGRKCSWNEYKRLLGKATAEAEASELLVTKFLVYPKPDFNALQTEWDPGLIMTLAGQIQKALGFQQKASLKNW
jgi:hypothetical protein